MITVEPTTFTKVEYDADELAGYVQAALERVSGIPDNSDVLVTVLEDAATTTFRIRSIDPLVLEVDGGAVENHKDPRRLGAHESAITFTRALLEVYDRRADWFHGPALDAADVSLAHKAAWDVNLHGRVAGLGVRLHKPRYLYNFRNRHGFTDQADVVFEQLWTAGETTWRRITELSDAAHSR
ncbi:MAG: hypothetical protein AAFN30_15355 [Actinomycetota bacterium]